jgi:hypothetical protein
MMGSRIVDSSVNLKNERLSNGSFMSHSIGGFFGGRELLGSIASHIRSVRDSLEPIFSNFKTLGQLGCTLQALRGFVTNGFTLLANQVNIKHHQKENDIVKEGIRKISGRYVEEYGEGVVPVVAKFIGNIKSESAGSRTESVGYRLKKQVVDHYIGGMLNSFQSAPREITFLAKNNLEHLGRNLLSHNVDVGQSTKKIITQIALSMWETYSNEAKFSPELVRHYNKIIHCAIINRFHSNRQELLDDVYGSLNDVLRSAILAGWQNKCTKVGLIDSFSNLREQNGGSHSPIEVFELIEQFVNNGAQASSINRLVDDLKETLIRVDRHISVARRFFSANSSFGAALLDFVLCDATAMLQSVINGDEHESQAEKTLGYLARFCKWNRSCRDLGLPVSEDLEITKLRSDFLSSIKLAIQQKELTPERKVVIENSLECICSYYLQQKQPA